MAVLDACSLQEEPFVCCEPGTQFPSDRYCALSALLYQYGFSLDIREDSSGEVIALGHPVAATPGTKGRLRRSLEICEAHVHLGGRAGEGGACGKRWGVVSHGFVWIWGFGQGNKKI